MFALIGILLNPFLAKILYSKLVTLTQNTHNDIFRDKALKRLQKPMKTKIKGLILIIIYILAITTYNNELIIQKEKVAVALETTQRNNASNSSEAFKQAMNNGEMDKIKALMLELKNSKFEDVKKLAIDADVVIAKYKDLSEVRKSLENMSDDEFQKLKQGKLDKNFFEYKYFNDNFNKLLLENANERESLIATKKKRDEEAKILAQKQAEEKKKKEEEEKIQAQKQAEEAARVAQAQERKNKIESQFSAWDGSHRTLERYVKSAMNDPDSYKHESTTYADKGDYLLVQTTFRGKNAFGGVVRNTITAKLSLDGDLLEILK